MTYVTFVEAMLVILQMFELLAFVSQKKTSMLFPVQVFINLVTQTKGFIKLL
jgi:hypothetical protein